MTISKPTTQSQDASTSSQEAHPAKTSALPENKPELQAIAHPSGLSNCEYTENPKQLSLFGKMCLGLLATDLTEFSGVFPKAGTMRSGKLSAQPPLERPTCGSVYFLLPTPLAYSGTHRPGQTKLDRTLKLLPTPTASDGVVGQILNENTEIRYTKNGTPRKYSNQGVNGSVGLARYLALLPTPTTRDRRSPGQLKRNEPGLSLTLGIPTGQVLNPQFVEWMQGFPIGWTDLAPSEMPSSPNALPSPCNESSSSPNSLKKSIEPHLINNKAIGGDNPESRLASYLFGVNAPIGGDDFLSPPMGDSRRAELIEERDRLLEEGYIPPDNCWVDVGKMTRGFIKCWYRSTKPIFNGRKSHYIGREDSPAAKEARRAIARRNRLRAIAKELKSIEKEINNA